MNKHDRQLQDLLMTVSEGEIAMEYPGLAQIAAEQYKRIFGRSRRTERERAAVKAKRQKQQGRREKVSAIREQSVPVGALCAIPGCGVTAKHAHHIISGSGNRRTYEAADTLAPLCNWHHESIHKGHLIALCALAVWAASNASEQAQAALEHRIDKVREARAASRADERSER